jgi:hypothetical protein
MLHYIHHALEAKSSAAGTDAQRFFQMMQKRAELKPVRAHVPLERAGLLYAFVHACLYAFFMRSVAMCVDVCGLRVLCVAIDGVCVSRCCHHEAVVVRCDDSLRLAQLFGRASTALVCQVHGTHMSRRITAARCGVQ